MRILLLFGTRPEAVKLAPVALALRARGMEALLANTGQHPDFETAALSPFGLESDLAAPFSRTAAPAAGAARLLTAADGLLTEAHPDLALVQGDTATAAAGAEAAFYRRIPVAHVEAGLRSGDLSAPFPEEYLRKKIALLARVHFAPTRTAVRNLLREGCRNVHLTGNTVVDALCRTVRPDYTHPALPEGPFVLFTLHRRECTRARAREWHAMLRTLTRRTGLPVLYPVHADPARLRAAEEDLGDCPGVRLLPPLGVADFHNFLARAALVLTDSGGVQEEAVSLGRPLLVLRRVGERQEGGERFTDAPEGALRQALSALANPAPRFFPAAPAVKEGGDGTENAPAAALPSSPYGDGHAGGRIAAILRLYASRRGL